MKKMNTKKRTEKNSAIIRTKDKTSKDKMLFNKFRIFKNKSKSKNCNKIIYLIDKIE
jgi:hypothetical protein